jgi:transcriptional regulator with GAF, ATPase, and Fis domain
MGSTRMNIEERIDVEALLKSIGSLQDLQFRRTGLEPAMQQVVDAAKTLFKADGAGLMLIGQGEALRWVTATDPRAQVIEAAQERLGQGPCVDAFEQGTLQLIPDTAAEKRWPELTRVLRHDGVHALLSVPVQVAQGTVGSLNFYLAEPHEWDHSERNAAEVYGRLAGALLGSALTVELQGRLIEQLQWALDHRILIEQAKGILMEREGISADYGLVFCQENGEPLHPGRFLKAFGRLVRDTGLPSIRLHDLRHGWRPQSSRAVSIPRWCRRGSATPPSRPR